MLTDGWLGRYKIIKKIGSGGMGEVYLCEDPKLNRQIALKTLPADVAADSSRMHRFIAEAKSASALNHPNIITIYEINDDHETPFIAMEYVRGETLGKAVRRGPLELSQAIDVAGQVAGALAAAHEANIVHRDIKPDNIIIRPDGLVKVLDFGLAKLTENDGTSDPEAETIAHRTNPGMILGTASYMSPEQARGKEVDGRSDIFSFGTVLFQMLSGKLPFSGENYVDVIGAILHKEPQPLSELAPDVPRDIEALIRKSLRKNREERYQNVRELLADLKEIRADLNLEIGSLERAARISEPGFRQSTASGLTRPISTAGHTGFATSSISRLIEEFKMHPMRAGLALIVGLAAVTGIGAWFANYTAPATAEAFQRMRFTRATTSGDIVTEQVALSPDGKYVAYVSERDGSQSLWVKQVEVPSSVELVAPSRSEYMGLTFSPNGNHIYYSIDDGTGTASLFEIPVLGGAPRRIRTHVGGHMAFSPDSRRFSFIKGETALVVSSIEGGDPITIAESSPGDRWLVTAWSPDATKLVAAIYSASDSRCRLLEVDLADGKVTPIPGPAWLRIGGLKWLPDGNGLVMTARDLETQLSQVWLVSYPEGEARRITNDPNSYQGISVSADGSSIASVRQERLVNIWKADGANAAISDRVTRELGRDEGMSGVSWMPDGRVVYTVRLAGSQDLWITGSDGQRQLTFNAGSNFSPAVSPDGRHIAFISSRDGNPSLWRMNADGEDQVKLIDQQGIAGEPEFTPDGQWVVYDLTDDSNKTTIWKVRLDGGDPVQLTNYESGRPEVSPDGRSIAFELGSGPRESSKLGIISIDGGDPMRVLDLPEVIASRNFRWANDGSGFVFVRNIDNTFNIWLQPLDGGTPTRITEFESERIYRFDLARTTGEFALSRGTESSDVVVISDFR